MDCSPTIMTNNNSIFHASETKWTIYSHLPHDTDWALKSYESICVIDCIEQLISVLDIIPDKMIKNCMLFIMREDITPLWEDKKNREGGCFSYKIANNDVPIVWKNLCYLLVGETLFKKKANITGITISPKKNFCIIKIWMGDCENQNPQDITSFDGIEPHGCLFKKHLPEY
jgi:hypothetical protein